jgi:hypothetical protein
MKPGKQGCRGFESGSTSHFSLFSDFLAFSESAFRNSAFGEKSLRSIDLNTGERIIAGV